MNFLSLKSTIFGAVIIVLLILIGVQKGCSSIETRISNEEKLRRLTQKQGKLVVLGLNATTTGYAEAKNGWKEAFYGLTYQEEAKWEVDLSTAKVEANYGEGDNPFVKITLEPPKVDKGLLKGLNPDPKKKKPISRGSGKHLKQAQAVAEAQIRDNINACFTDAEATSDYVNMAKRNAELVLKQFYSGLGISDVTIIWNDAAKTRSAC